MWFYFVDGTRKGPVSDAELKKLVESNVVKPETTIQTDGGAVAKAKNIKGLTFDRNVSDGVLPSLNPVLKKLTAIEEILTAFSEKISTFDAILGSLDARLTKLETLLDDDSDDRNEEESFDSSCDLTTSSRMRDYGSATLNFSAGIWHIGVDLNPGRYRIQLQNADGVSTVEQTDRQGEYVKSFCLSEDSPDCVMELEDGDAIEIREPLVFEYLSPIIRRRRKN